MCQNGRQFRAAVAGSHALDETSVQQQDASLLLRRAVERRDGTIHDSEWCVLRTFVKFRGYGSMATIAC